MLDLLFRLTKCSLWVVTKVIELPFHIWFLAMIVVNAVKFGFAAFFLPAMICEWVLGIQGSAMLFVPGGVAAGLLQLARGLHSAYVRGEYPE